MKPFLPAPALQAQVDELKFPSQETCPAIPACPEGAIRHVANKTATLGAGCGDCVTACCGNAIALAEVTPTPEENPQEEGESNMLTIKVLGPGCANCPRRPPR